MASNPKRPLKADDLAGEELPGNAQLPRDRGLALAIDQRREHGPSERKALTDTLVLVVERHS